MSSRLTVAALELAVADRQPQAGLVHHSDRGLLAACSPLEATLQIKRITSGWRVVRPRSAGFPTDSQGALCGRENLPAWFCGKMPSCSAD
jgi:hypothetical protein